MKILLGEDDLRLGKLIVHMLKKECHTTDWAKNGEEVFDYLSGSDYNLVILDWMMPGKDGIQVCKELRASGYTKGILMLTAKDALQDRVMGLDAGADDYLVKPFEFEELFARIRSIARRIQHELTDNLLTVGPFTLDLNEHTFSRFGEQMPLTVREFQLLEILMRNKGRVVTREALLSHIWGYDADVTNNTLDAIVKLVRKKVNKDDHIFIQNIRGVGFKLEVDHVLQNP
ncbi:response regulator transcription factor [Brevibacillus fluminis]|uniref:response regulator transcription factor n=1 Tax=Brevibacillus fluminis TaxID=511487 RepID=UPI003F8BCF51